MNISRIILLVMDSVGCGELPDAAEYGDEGAHTLGHIAERVGGLSLPYLASLGLGNIVDLLGMPPIPDPKGAFGKCGEISAGKDTTTGHWELAGLKTDTAFPVFPNGFPEAILAPFRERTGRGILGNKPASGTEIIQELGQQHRDSGDLIIYTSADSVFQIAAHEDVVPVPQLYQFCEVARDILDPYQVGRVIARPFVGDRPGEFKRTYNRRDYAMPPPSPTVLDALENAAVPVIGIGKIGDIYARQGVTKDIHSEGNRDGMRKVAECLDQTDRGLIMTNLVDFDSLYGHRRDPQGYYQCLREFDEQLVDVVAKLRPDSDLLIMTADHGNDPTMPGTDHTREYVPLLCVGSPQFAGVDLGTRSTFADIGATIAEIFAATPPPYGTSFLSQLDH